MNTDLLLDAISNMDDELIENHIIKRNGGTTMRKEKKSWKPSKWMYIALAAVLVVASVAAAVAFWPRPETPVAGPELGT